MSLTQEAFVQFLRTGGLDDVAVGVARATVAERLGSPPEVTRLRRGVTLWAYAGRLLQVTLAHERVVLLGIYLRYASATSPDLPAGGVPLPPGVDRRALAGKLREWLVPYRESRALPGAYEVGDGGVLAVFAEDGALESLQVALRG